MLKDFLPAFELLLGTLEITIIILIPLFVHNYTDFVLGIME